MKKIFLTLLTAVFIFTVSQGQDSTRHHQFTSLNLTADQKNQIAALQKEHHTKFMAILTPEQREQFEKQKQEIKTRRKQRTPGLHKRMKTELQQAPKETVQAENGDVYKANQLLAKAELNKQCKSQMDEVKLRLQKPSGR